MNRFLLVFILLNSSLILSAQKGRIHNWSLKKDKGTYYEGNYSLEVSTPPLEIIGLYDLFEPFEYNRGQRLFVYFSYPKKDYFFLKAEEKQILQFYMMESKPDTLQPPTHTFGPWPVDGIMSSINVSPSNLSVLLRLQSDVSNHYLPVSVCHEKKPDKLPNYQVVFRLGRNIARGEFKVYTGEFADTPAESHLVQRSRIGTHLAGRTFNIEIDRAKLEDYSGWVTVKVDLQEKNRAAGIPLQFYLYHP